MITSINKFKKIFENATEYRKEIQNEIELLKDNIKSYQWMMNHEDYYSGTSYIEAESKIERMKKRIKELESTLGDSNIEDKYKSNITEDVDTDVDTDNIPKALEDIDERRPNRMKRPPKSYNSWSGRGGEPGLVYIQDEAEEVMQDKYGRDRGTRNWEASIGHGARGGAMFKMADDVMKEKQFLFDELGLQPDSYWDYSYFGMWKKWMDKIGKSYKVDSDEEVQAKKDAKEQAKKEAEQAKNDKELQNNIDAINNRIDKIKNKYSSLELDKYKPGTKDIDRIESLMKKTNKETNAKKMANAIKNKSKAIKRGLAMLDYTKNIQNPNSFTYIGANLAEPFFDKAMSLNESYTINEGQFSWFTQDTDTQIGSMEENKIDVYMYDNKGNKWHEPNYQGYGVFGGKDYYVLLAEMNGYTGDEEKLRSIGIDLEFNKTYDEENAETIYPALVTDSNYDINKHDFTTQPKHDPDQGWFTDEDSEEYEDEYEDDYDEDEDDMYESKLFTSINEFKQYLIKETVNESIEDKDWKRMSNLIKKNKDGAGVARTIKNKDKAIARFVAGLKLSNETPNYNNGAYKNSFSDFGNRALELGATKEEIQNLFDNTESKQDVEKSEEPKKADVEKDTNVDNEKAEEPKKVDNTNSKDKEKLKSEIYRLENELYQTYDQDEIKKLKREISKLKRRVKKLAPEIVPGGTYTVVDFADSLSYGGKKDTPEKKFFKEARLYDDKELEIIRKMIRDYQGVYNYFNKKYEPISGTIKRVVLDERKEDVKSNNIYDKMGAKKEADVRYELQVKLSYREEPITLVKHVTEDTTISQSDIRAFM